MSSQMQTLSARVPSEDLEWLASLNIPGAVSPSDKLRTLIGQMRRQHEGTIDYAAGLAWLRELLAPFVTAMRALEHQHRTHSEALSLAAEWLPQLMATLLSARPAGRDARDRAVETEDIVVQRCMQFLTSLLRLAITQQAACYNPAVVDKHLPQVLEVAEIVAAQRKPRKS